MSKNNNNGNNLGKGLAALLGDVGIDADYQNGLKTLSVLDLKPGEFQPRHYFDPEKLATLRDSIKERGILQPLIVRKLQDSTYEIIAGERRWRAAQAAGLTVVPVIEINCNDTEALEIGLIENLQRDDLNPMEEAESLQKLMEQHKKTQEEVAKAISKSRSYVANMVRLNTLPEKVKGLIRQGQISAGHARTLVTAENVDELIQKILTDKISVREAEKMAQTKKNKERNLGNPYVDPDLLLLAERIQQMIGMSTKIDITSRGGVVKIHFNALEELDYLVNKLATMVD
jgi:ParB family chromosome partitioning protein